MRALTSSGLSGSGGSFLPLLAGAWLVTMEIMVAVLEVVSSFAFTSKRPSIAIMLADADDIKQKGNYSEKMGRVSDAAKTGRLHALLPDGPGRDCGGSRKGP